jgi:dCMP deaminase
MKLRNDWDTIWGSLAESLSKRSSDPKFKVGVVIVTQDNTQVLAVGYNGDHHGGPNRRDSMEAGKSGFLHAEINALIKMDYTNHKPKKMYITHMPCTVCSKAIVNGGIKEVVYINDYTDTHGITILASSGIKVRQIGT